MEIEKSELDRKIDLLLEKEKQSRSINDHIASANILKQIVTLCKQLGEFDKMNEMIQVLMKKRGQPKKAQIEMVQLVMSWLPSIVNKEVKTRVIETIRDVTDKKIFLEVEYARCVLMIVQNKEDANNINEAAKILQEVQVETYGSMDRREKLEFILYQMKIMIKKEDYIRLFIISKKVNEANLNDEKLVDLKVLFYSYMAIYNNHHNKYLEAATCYKTIWETLKSTQKQLPNTLDFNFSIRYNDVLANYVGFLVLHKYSEETTKQLEALHSDEEIERTAHVYKLVSAFLSKEISSCDITNYSLDSFQLFTTTYENNQVHKSVLRNMLIQHNIRVMSHYYERLKLPRMAALIGVSEDDTEEQLCDMMNAKLVSCHIDRLDKVIDFKPPQNENSVLESWNTSINQILEMIDRASNLIHRENELAGPRQSRENREGGMEMA